MLRDPARAGSPCHEGLLLVPQHEGMDCLRLPPLQGSRQTCMEHISHDNKWICSWASNEKRGSNLLLCTPHVVSTQRVTIAHAAYPVGAVFYLNRSPERSSAGPDSPRITILRPVSRRPR